MYLGSLKVHFVDSANEADQLIEQHDEGQQ